MNTNIDTMSELTNLFRNIQFKCSVSSVLNKDVKQHGKAFLFDGLEDTAWYSDQGLPQSITIVFDEPLEVLDLSVSQLKIKFQGGFAGSVMNLSIDDVNKQNVYKNCFYPDDINDMQTFALSTNKISSDQKISTPQNIKRITISFEKSSDFFGRIIIYHLEMLT